MHYSEETATAFTVSTCKTSFIKLEKADLNLREHG